MLKCPRCGVLLNEITKAGILVDVCDQCRGMWLDRGEMERITARVRELEHDWDRRERPRHDDGHGDARRPPEQQGPYPKKKRWTEIFDVFD